MDVLQTLKAMEDIRQLKARYLRFLDTQDWVGMETIFTDDAVFDLRNVQRNGNDKDTEASRAGPEHEVKGRDRIVASLKQRVATARTVHHGHMHEIVMQSDDIANGILAFEDHNIYRQPDGSFREMKGAGHYHETYVREADGAWKVKASLITRLRVDITFRS